MAFVVMLSQFSIMWSAWNIGNRSNPTIYWT